MPCLGRSGETLLVRMGGRLGGSGSNGGKVPGLGVFGAGDPYGRRVQGENRDRGRFKDENHHSRREPTLEAIGASGSKGG
jgi:hypothetical protein